MSASPFFLPQVFTLAHVIAEDEDVCLAFRSALALMRGKEIPPDDQEFIAGYMADRGQAVAELASKLGKDGQLSHAAALSPRNAGELVALILGLGGRLLVAIGMVVLDLHLEGCKRGVRTQPYNECMLSDIAPFKKDFAEVAIARQLAADDLFRRDFWVSVALIRGHVVPVEDLAPLMTSDLHGCAFRAAAALMKGEAVPDADAEAIVAHAKKIFESFPCIRTSVAREDGFLALATLLESRLDFACLFLSMNLRSRPETSEEMNKYLAVKLLQLVKPPTTGQVEAESSAKATTGQVESKSSARACQ